MGKKNKKGSSNKPQENKNDNPGSSGKNPPAEKNKGDSEKPKKTPDGKDQRGDQSHPQPKQPQSVWGKPPQEAKGRGKQQQEQPKRSACSSADSVQEQTLKLESPVHASIPPRGMVGQGHQQQQQPQRVWGKHDGPRPQEAQGFQVNHPQPKQPQSAWGKPPQEAIGRGKPQQEQPPRGTIGQGHQQQRQPQSAWGKHDGPRPQEARGFQVNHPQPKQPQSAWGKPPQEAIGRGKPQQEQPPRGTIGQGHQQQRQPQSAWGKHDGPRPQEARGFQVNHPQPKQPQSTSGKPPQEAKGRGKPQQEQPKQSACSSADSVQKQTSKLESPVHASSPPRGTIGQPFSLETNYLTLNLDKMPDVAYHYDVKIDPDRPKKYVRLAFYEYVKKFLPNTFLAYDGKANAYSVDLLPEAILNANADAQVEVIEGDRKIPFKVALKATDDIEIDLKSLRTYHKDRIFDKPMRALQCIEVVISSICHEKGVRAGRSFYTKPDRHMDLGDGFELWLGIYQAAMLCDQPLLNIDVSHKSFPSAVKLDKLYDSFRFKAQYKLGEFLKGLRVNYEPPMCFNSTTKGFKFLKVMRPSSIETFKTEQGGKMTVEAYFKSKGYQLRRPDLPCLHIGSTMKTNYVPLEFLSVPPGQAILRKDSEMQVRNMIRYAATSTQERKQKIMGLLRKFNYYIHPNVERFGINVGNQFIEVQARLLPAPNVQYRRSCKSESISINTPGEWKMNNFSFFSCEKKSGDHQWAIINISKKPEINPMFLKETFVNLLISTARKLGMSLAPNYYDIIEPGDSTGGDRYGNPKPISIIKDLTKLKQQKMSIVFVILPPNASESYSKVKQEAELQCGIVTQCIKGETIRSDSRNGLRTINSVTMSNILLKVNAKLNGTNHIIAPNNEISLQRSEKVMFVGADVSHPSPLQKNLPSIVGVVASHDLFGAQYNMQYRLQSPGIEEIADMADIFEKHLMVFKEHTKHFPDNIIYYRDGVSDGQFQKVKNIELAAMRAACKKFKCDAKFTCIIVVKRHHTRFFPKGNSGEGSFNNVKAGTIVDRTIIHPNEVQFFLCSHKAIQGTSKPTRYNVIADDANIRIDDMQALTYNLCHMFPRCNRSVSYPAPAYLAHLVALRGRAYIEGSNLNLGNLKGEYERRSVSKDMKINPMYFV